MRRREAETSLVEIGRRFDGRGWVSGTSGNFSAVLARQPLRLLMTTSGTSKGRLTPADLVAVADSQPGTGGPRQGAAGKSRKPSAEALLHLEIVRQRGAGAVLHTHSIWSTLLSHAHRAEGGLAIEGYEMLKGLEGVRSHEHREWLPIIDNSQDMRALAAAAAEAMARHPGAHGFLIHRHGLYTWGNDLPQAERHIEILEFLLEAVGRSRLADAGPRI